nr:hypothetical protein [Kofleriaceae bacterium]
MTPRAVTARLCALFFASGASALVLENLWFREAARLLGNSVWATSIVLAAFMGGLAIGGGVAARRGARAVRLVRLYGLLELAIAVTAGVVVVVLPQAGELFAPVFRALAPNEVATDVARLAVAFALMIVPAAAMGATLPVLVTALHRADPEFGRVLGRLYGVNTLGAVAGILAVELVLVPELGIRGAAACAVGLELVAGAVALRMSRALDAAAAPPAASSARPALDSAARRILAAGFLCGALFLALEVVWMRFLALYVLSTTIALSLMLAVILGGIAIGGLVAAHVRVRAAIAPLAAAAGVLVIAGYALFPADQTPGSDRWQDAVIAALRLPLPVAIISGALFARLADAARARIGASPATTGRAAPEAVGGPDDVRATGLYVVANTLGSMVGALAGGFVLLPAIGMEGSLFVLAAGYLIVAVVAPAANRRALAASALALVVALAVFPFGRLVDRHLPQVLSPLTGNDATLVDYREGLTATLALVENRFAGQVYAHQLLTDGYSMSSSFVSAQRYMKLFVYWPVALRPDTHDALLVCYGVGQTAKALTDTQQLRHVDVVDISRDILDLAHDVFPTGSPLDDPRVDVHVEDGRFFLQTTDRRYDLITGEPPPPQVAGVVDLYSREYFDLVRAHLTDGGVTTYWLPVHDLSVDDARSISRAFCDAFPDCSLWDGFGYDFMLVGTRDFAGGATEAQIAAPWHDPRVAPTLAAVGLEHPEQLGATFMADSATLAQWIGDAPPVDDDHPDRLGHRLAQLSPDRYAAFDRWLDPRAARERFAASPLIAKLFPPALRARTLAYFDAQAVLDEPALELFGARVPMATRLADLARIQDTTDLRAPVEWLLGLSSQQLDLLATASPDDLAKLAYPRAVLAIADRRFADAAALLEHASPYGAFTAADLAALRAYAASRR